MPALDGCGSALSGGRVLRRHKVGDFFRLLNVEFTGLAVLANSAVVVDTVGGVGILLDLSNEDSLAYCMQSSALNKEYVALVHRNVV